MTTPRYLWPEELDIDFDPYEMTAEDLAVFEELGLDLEVEDECPDE